MKYQLDPLSPTGVSPVQLTPTQIAMSVGGGGDTFWESNTYGTESYLQPVDTTNGFVLGADLHSSLHSFGFSAVFNDSTTTAVTGTGINYFGTIAYGISFIPLGGVYVSGHARGTSSSPTQTLSGDYIGAFIGTGYSGSGWITSGATHILPGLWSQATADVGTYLEQKIFIGGAATPMISFESSSNAIKLNEAQLAATTTIYNDLGASLTLDGSTGAALFTNSTATSIPVTVKGYTAQSANLQEWQDSAGTVLAEIFANGQLAITSSGGGISNGTTNVYGARQSINTVANGNIGLVIRAAGPSQTADLQEWQSSAGTPLAYIDSAGLGGFAGLNITDAKNIVLGSTTGTKIGTATTQKIGLWNATPIVQPTTAIAASTFAANTSGIVDDSATWDGYTIGQVVKALRNIGALA